jgi:hypothetical protein
MKLRGGASSSRSRTAKRLPEAGVSACMREHGRGAGVCVCVCVSCRRARAPRGAAVRQAPCLQLPVRTWCGACRGTTAAAEAAGTATAERCRIQAQARNSHGWPLGRLHAGDRSTGVRAWTCCAGRCVWRVLCQDAAAYA